jgi:hypothetical protein
VVNDRLSDLKNFVVSSDSVLFEQSSRHVMPFASNSESIRCAHTACKSPQSQKIHLSILLLYSIFYPRP